MTDLTEQQRAEIADMAVAAAAGVIAREVIRHALRQIIAENMDSLLAEVEAKH